jgi:glutathione S-transferase
VNAWADAVQLPAVAGLVVADIVPHLGPEDRAYFIASREKRYGEPLAEVVAGRETRVEAFRQTTLQPLRLVLRERPWSAARTGRPMPTTSPSGPSSGRAASAPSRC